MIGVLVVTHLNIASHMIEAAERVIGKQEMLSGIDLESEDSLDRMTDKILEQVRNCSEAPGGPCGGILILTDLFGSTPTNASLLQIQKSSDSIEIITGVNLPMLLSALAYRRRLPLAELAQKVMADGQKGIRDAKSILLSRV